MKHPTRTVAIEKAWYREINRRWREMNKAIMSYFDEPITNEVPTDAQQVRRFMAYLNAQINEILLAGGNNWQAKYQLQSYDRALQRVRASLKAQGSVLALTPEDISMAAQLSPSQFTATATLGASVSIANKAPIHQDALEFLFTRSYESLEGWTTAFSRETRQILMEGVQQGKNTRVIAKDIQKRLGVSRSRARTIATTEVIQAYQQSSSNEVKRAQEELGEEIGMRWISAEDSKVRPLHAGWNGTVVSQEQNASRITASPINCRCGQAPVLMSERE